ncbi:MAG: class II aldolase/adducin family protein [bacterium]
MLEAFQKIGRLLFQEGLIDAFGGNLSVREGDKIFITRRDVMLFDLTNDDIIEVGLESDPNDSQASRELEAHRAIYQKCSAKAIVHAHPANAIAISITDNKIVPQDAVGQMRFKAAPIVRARDSVGSQEAARLLPQFLGGENTVAVVKGHGSFAIGKDLTQAYMATSALENSCKILVAVRSSKSSQSSLSSSNSSGPSHHRKVGPQRSDRKSAIPPSIGVMGRDRNRNR